MRLTEENNLASAEEVLEDFGLDKKVWTDK